MDRKYAAFSTAFEQQYLNQSFQVSRSIAETLDIGWKLLGMLPQSELKRVDQKWIDQYYPTDVSNQ